MSEQTSQEPTMEEILASIRRIISEDESPEGEAGEAAATEEAPAAVAAPEPEPATANEPEPPPEPAPVAVAAAPAPEPEPEPAPAAEEEEALELTEKVETHGDLDVFPASPAETPRPAAPPVAALVSERAATAAASAFGQLSAAILMPQSERTLEDVVREMLRPMLQQWLDANLPGIVQQAVEAEVERIARGRVR